MSGKNLNAMDARGISCVAGSHSRFDGLPAGGDDLAQPLQNLAINGAAVAVFGFVLRRDLQASERDKQIVRREEALARLQACSMPPAGPRDIVRIRPRLLRSPRMRSTARTGCSELTDGSTLMSCV